MFKSFKEFLLREKEEEEDNKYDKGPLVDFLNSFDENTLNPPLNKQQIKNCLSFIYQGIDKNKDGVIKRNEINSELNSQNIGFFCLSFKMKPRAIVNALKKFFYYDVIYQRLGRDGLDIFTKAGKIRTANNQISWNWSAEEFYKKIYEYKNGKIFIIKSEVPSKKNIEEGLLDKAEEIRKAEEAKKNEEETHSYDPDTPTGNYKLSEVGEKLNEIMALISGMIRKELFSDDLLRDFANYSDIEKLFKNVDIEEAENIMKNPPRRNPFKDDSNYDPFISTDEKIDKADETIKNAKEELKEKPKVKLKNGTYDIFSRGDNVSINGNDETGKATGVYGFDVRLPAENDIRTNSFDELWNKKLNDIKEQLLNRLDKACLEYLKTHYAKQISHDIKEWKIFNFKFSKYKIINEESDFVKNIGLSKDMIKDEQKRHDALKKLIDSTFSSSNKEFETTKKDALSLTKKLQKKPEGKHVVDLIIKLQAKYRHIAFMAASLLKKTKIEMNNSTGDLPNNLNEVYKELIEDLNKTGDDAFLVARFIFVAIINKFKNDPDYVAKIMAGNVPLSEVFKKINLGNEGIVYESTCKNNKSLPDSRNVFYQDSIRFKDIKQLFNENEIRYWTELSDENAVKKLFEVISNGGQEFKLLSDSGELVKKSNSYIQEYNAINKKITSTATEATIDLTGYEFMPNAQKNIKDIALRQRMAKFTLFQKEPASNIYIIIRNEDANKKLQELRQQLSQNTQRQSTEQKPEQAQQQSTEQKPEQNQQQSTEQKPAEQPKANAAVTTASVDPVYPPSNAYKKRMREIIYRKGPLTIKYKD